MPNEPHLSPQTKILLLERDIEDLKKHQDEHDRKLRELESERNKALKWGIITLGSMVVSLLAGILTFAKDHLFK